MDFIKRDGPPPRPIKILVVAAHHDDIEFGPAGSVARWISEGQDVTYCIVTDGGAGSNEPGVKRDDLVALRREEQMRAAAVVGVEDVRFLGYPDGELEPTLALRRDITRVIRDIRPDRVVLSDPTMMFSGDGYINHPDHRAAAEAALYAVFPSSESRPIFANLLDEGFEPHKVSEVYMNFTDHPTHYVDTTDFLERKLDSLRCHVSQIGEGEETEKGVIDMVRKWNKEAGEQLGVGAAEMFRVMHLHEINGANGAKDGAGEAAKS